MAKKLTFEDAVHSSLEANTSRNGEEAWEDLSNPILEICRQHGVNELPRISDAIRKGMKALTMRDMPGGHDEDALDRAHTVETYVNGILSRLPLRMNHR